MKKYLYYVVDSAGKHISSFNHTREEAREDKRLAEIDGYAELFGDKPPYKIVRYELANPKVVR